MPLYFNKTTFFCRRKKIYLDVKIQLNGLGIWHLLTSLDFPISFCLYKYNESSSFLESCIYLTQICLGEVLGKDIKYLFSNALILGILIIDKVNFFNLTWYEFRLFLEIYTECRVT